MQELTTRSDLDIKSKIYTIRDKQVMLDSDLAELYKVETKVFNQAVKRNIKRFPKHFRFQLTKEEYDFLRSQIVTSKIITENRGGNRYLPYVFTEQGVSMLSAILKSDIAIDISIKIIDTFVSMRKLISSNDFFVHQLNKLEKRQISYEIKNDTNIDKIFKALENKDHIQEQGIFFNGQIFDAHNFVSDLIRKAKSKIVLIDNYVDDTTLSLFEKNQNIDVTIYTNTISNSLKNDLAKYNKQYRKITIKENKDFHDRFLILDEKEVYHIGASLKDLGKKVFGFSLMKDFNPSLLKLK